MRKLTKKQKDMIRWAKCRDVKPLFQKSWKEKQRQERDAHFDDILLPGEQCWLRVTLRELHHRIDSIEDRLDEK